MVSVGDKFGQGFSGVGLTHEGFADQEGADVALAELLKHRVRLVLFSRLIHQAKLFDVIDE